MVIVLCFVCTVDFVCVVACLWLISYEFLIWVICLKFAFDLHLLFVVFPFELLLDGLVCRVTD